jgi:hypothetical protein
VAASTRPRGAGPGQPGQAGQLVVAGCDDVPVVGAPEVGAGLVGGGDPEVGVELIGPVGDGDPEVGAGDTLDWAGGGL